MQRSATPPPETTPSWAAGVRRRIPFYLLAAFLLALLAAVITFIYLEQLRASMVPTATALVALLMPVSGILGQRLGQIEPASAAEMRLDRHEQGKVF